MSELLTTSRLLTAATIAFVILIGVMIWSLSNQIELTKKYKAYCQSQGMDYLELADTAYVGKTISTKREYLCLTKDGRIVIIPEGV